MSTKLEFCAPFHFFVPVVYSFNGNQTVSDSLLFSSSVVNKDLSFKAKAKDQGNNTVF